MIRGDYHYDGISHTKLCFYTARDLSKHRPGEALVRAIMDLPKDVRPNRYSTLEDHPRFFPIKPKDIPYLAARFDGTICRGDTTDYTGVLFLRKAGKYDPVEVEMSWGVGPSNYVRHWGGTWITMGPELSPRHADSHVKFENKFGSDSPVWNSLSSLFKTILVLLHPDFAEAHDYRDDMEQLELRIPVGPHSWECDRPWRDLTSGLPGVFWIQAFGPPYVKMIGEKRFETCPAWKKERLENGLWIIQSAPTAIQFREPEVLDLTDKIRAHLGEEFFFDARDLSRRVRVPEFDFSEIILAPDDPRWEELGRSAGPSA